MSRHPVRRAAVIRHAAAVARHAAAGARHAAAGARHAPAGARHAPAGARRADGPLRGRALCAAVLAIAVLIGPALAGPAAAEDGEPAVVDPLADGAAPPSGADLAGSVRLLEPVVRALEPVVRDLQTEEHDGARTTVAISSDVLFAFDSADLTAHATGVVADLAERIAATGSDVSVVGHTDGIGSRRYNQRLSERRAGAVADLLRARLGDGRTITTEGRNFSEPVAEETVNGMDDPAGRARNRRVEIAFDEPS